MDISVQNKSGTSGMTTKAPANLQPHNEVTGSVLPGSDEKSTIAGPESKDNGNAPVPASFLNPASLDSFDLSAYDPLQAHVLQIAASAGYTYPNPTTSAPIAQGQLASHGVTVPTGTSILQPQQYLPVSRQAQAQSMVADVANTSLTGQSSQAIGTQQQQSQQYVSGAPVPLPAMTAAQPFLQPLAPMSTNGLTALAPGTTNASAAMPGYGNVPSVVSASTTVDSNSTSAPSTAPPSSKTFLKEADLPKNWATMSAEQRRRYERNIREQQRSFQISQQIKELRALLTESSIPFKPNKFSILISTSEYIKQLQTRAIMLDAEHRKLIDTIKQTSEMVNSGQPLPEETVSGADGNVGNDAEMLLVQGLDYRLVFDQSSAPLGVASLDGRIIDCNVELLSMFGCSREVLLSKTLFDLVHSTEEVFQAMGEMLKTEAVSAGTKRKAGDVEDGETTKPPLYWSGLVSKRGSEKVYLNVSLARTTQDQPKFFNFALTLS